MRFGKHTHTQGRTQTHTHTHPSLTWTDAANQLMNRATVRQQASEKVETNDTTRRKEASERKHTYFESKIEDLSSSEVPSISANRMGGEKGINTLFTYNMLSTLQKSIPVQGHLRLSSVAIFFFF